LTQTRWTITDVDTMPRPRDDTRYEIIAGELFVSTQPHYFHQKVSIRLCGALDDWSRKTGLGEANWAVGVIFAEDEAVAPDVVWISRARVAEILGADGKLHAAPDLVGEVLSPGSANERRDREAKLDAYGRRGVREYWIVDWRQRQVEIYRRQELELRLSATLFEEDTLESPLLPGFTLALGKLFADIPPE
jgi:Uma2 family endonuclease